MIFPRFRIYATDDFRWNPGGDCVTWDVASYNRIGAYQSTPTYSAARRYGHAAGQPCAVFNHNFASNVVTSATKEIVFRIIDVIRSDNVGRRADQDILANLYITVYVTVETNVTLFANLVTTDSYDRAGGYSYAFAGLAEYFCTLCVVMAVVALIAIQREFPKLFVA